jgi:hypothetical protein
LDWLGTVSYIAGYLVLFFENPDIPDALSCFLVFTMVLDWFWYYVLDSRLLCDVLLGLLMFQML